MQTDRSLALWHSMVVGAARLLRSCVRMRLAPLSSLLAFAVAGCAGPTAPTPTDAAQPTAAPSVTDTARPAATATIPAGMFVNPVLDRDFPDPDVLTVDGTYYAFATNGNGHNIQTARSTDLVHWDVLADALPRLPEWAVQDFGWAWAPEVTTFDGQTYLMYFTARFAMGQGGTQCIGLSSSEMPEGPYTPIGDSPFICQTGDGGSIDAASFVDADGTPWLLWKNDGNSGGGQTWIYLQQLTPDGQALIGEPTRLITADQRWEGILVEGPTLWRQADRYVLFYSANDYASPKYAAGIAVADAITGPYEKVGDDPFLATRIPAGIVGPGGQDVVVGPGGDTWILFHGWSPGAYRRLYLAPLQWSDGLPALPTLTREPIPMP